MKNRHLAGLFIVFSLGFGIPWALAQKPSSAFVKKPRLILQKIVSTYEELYPTTADKIKQIFWGSPPLAALYRPGPLTAGKDNLYITDISTGVVHVWNLNGKGVWVIKGEGEFALRSPAAVAEDPQGRIWVADTGDGQVKVFDPGGKAWFAFKLGPEKSSPGGLAVDAAGGQVWVSDALQHQILSFDFTGKFLGKLGKPGEKKGEFNRPAALAFYGDQLYVVDTLNARIQVFDRQGNALKTVGFSGDSPGTFGRPKALLLDEADRLWVADSLMGRVNIFSPQGELLGSFGGDKGPWNFGLLSGMARDRQGKVYVADSLTGKIWVFQLEYQ